MSLLSTLRKSQDQTAKIIASSTLSNVSSSTHYNYPRTINWYPGHMVKAQRLLQTDFLPRAQIILEIRDCRLPLSSINHHIEPLVKHKKRLIVFNKSDLLTTPQKKKLLRYIEASPRYQFYTNEDIDQNRIAEDVEEHEEKRIGAIFGDSRGEHTAKRICNVLKLLSATEQKWRSLPMMVAVLGFPNVGKSTLINSLRNLHSIRGTARVGHLAGVTRHISAFKICHYPLIHVLDTPGIYMPALHIKSDRDIDMGMKLALCGCLKDNVVGILEIADYLLWWLNNKTSDQNAVAKYMAFCGVKEKFENIESLMYHLGKRMNLFYQRYDRATNISFESQEIDIHSAAQKFVDQYRLGLLDKHFLDDIDIEMHE
eukprot:CAMPEP_0202688852 /NCGR_PEP_ID=MMETSP1385-20130828/4257_1 /ASSEMBLY_ACC=CAM_ASM_000861 /TAXON_ID=933848 /ORGANISM="Elphidium margaritaceum" /LENGTH=369 /DNA_ID=CAMNT_0049343903 /DNA_START=29 /DNA_END=1138 /DNA_ORIENTATION=+